MAEIFTIVAWYPSRMVGSDRRSRERFAVDERLVMPETRYEIIDGEVEYVPPADESHGTRHSKISALLEAYAANEYDVASDMLTRTSEKGDMAPDASVFPAARDPVTGGRRLEELAFEVVSTERLARAGRKAAALAARGVRRVFAIDVKRQRLLLWSTETGAWEMTDPGGTIDDPALVLPLPIDALVGAASEDDAIARAVLAKNTPAVKDALADSKAEGRAEGRAEGLRKGTAAGRAAGKRDALLAVLAARRLALSEREMKIINETDDEETLDRWIRKATVCTTTSEWLPVRAPEKKSAQRGAPKRKKR